MLGMCGSLRLISMCYLPTDWIDSMRSTLMSGLGGLLGRPSMSYGRKRSETSSEILFSRQARLPRRSSLTRPPQGLT